MAEHMLQPPTPNQEIEESGSNDPAVQLCSRLFLASILLLVGIKAPTRESMLTFCLESDPSTLKSCQVFTCYSSGAFSLENGSLGIVAFIAAS